MKRLHIAGLVLAVATISGCANMNYGSKLTTVSDGIFTGDIKKSIATLDQSTFSLNDAKTNAPTNLLYLMEVGQLKRLDGNMAGSTADWLTADGLVRAWEDQYRSDPGKVIGDIGSVLINDTTRTYEGRDYEKVMLSTGLATNHLSARDFDSARIEIKKMHERQALIAEYRSKVLEAAKTAAESKDIKATSFKELGGYPIETLEDPEVQGLKNSYESAYGNYLAGFVYEALGEPSLAAPGYRQAAQMRPNIPLLDDSLRDLDKRAKIRKADTVDTLIIVEAGLAPAVQTQKIGMLLPIPCKNGICPSVVQLSWPVIRPTNTAAPQSLNVDGTEVPTVLMTSVNAMARRSLYDEMPAIMARTAIRAVAKTAAQKAADEATQHAGNALGGFGVLLSLATKIAVITTEVADERVWRTLPDSYSIARLKLTPGKHTVSFGVNGQARQIDIYVKGRYDVASIRVVGSQVYAAGTSTVRVSKQDGQSGNQVADASKPLVTTK